MSPATLFSHLTRAGFPRVSGDEPPNGYGESYVAEFSPRERG